MRQGYVGDTVLAPLWFVAMRPFGVNWVCRHCGAYTHYRICDAGAYPDWEKCRQELANMPTLEKPPVLCRIIERFDNDGKPHGDSAPAWELQNVATHETVAAVWKLHGQLHRRDGLAIVLPPPGTIVALEDDPQGEACTVDQYSPGESRAWWRGMAIKESWVLDRPTLEEIRAEQNADLRACAIDLYGLKAYIEAIGAKCLDADVDDRLAARELYEVPGLPYRVLIATDGSSKRIYEIAVPAECRTCAQAGEALNGVTDADVIAES